VLETDDKFIPQISSIGQIVTPILAVRVSVILNITVNGDGVKEVRPKQTNSFTIHVKDQIGKPYNKTGLLDFLSVEYKDYKVESSITDSKDGSFLVQYIPPALPGEGLVISVLFRGKHVSGSPFHAQLMNESKTSITGKFVRKWGKQGSDDNSLYHPLGITTDKDYVYVCERSNHRIHVFTKQGLFVRQWGSSGSGTGQFSNPYDVAIDARNCIYVADHGNKRIQVFTREGTFLRLWKVGVHCRGIAVDGSQVYVSDNEFIYVFSDEGGLLRKWGGRGSENGKLSNPTALVVADGEVYVADYLNNRIQVFSKEGTYLRKFGNAQSGDGSLNGPFSIAISGEFVYVGDNSRRIQAFTKDGIFVAKWGSGGSGNGQFRYPYGVVVDNGLLYVADHNNHRIQVFE